MNKPALVVGILSGAVFVQSFSASLVKSPNFDEITHIAGGMSYWRPGG